MKTKYRISIEETVAQDFELEADSFDEALKIAERKYKNGEWVLTPGHLVGKQICAGNENGESVGWYEF